MTPRSTRVEVRDVLTDCSRARLRVTIKHTLAQIRLTVNDEPALEAGRRAQVNAYRSLARISSVKMKGYSI